MNKDKITIDGRDYIPADSAPAPQAELDGLPYVVIRSANSGAHAGYMVRRDGGEVELTAARRLWYWSGAASLSQLALEGVKNPDECKFPPPINITVLGVCEVIEGSEAARDSIEGVEPWRQ